MQCDCLLRICHVLSLCFYEFLAAGPRAPLERGRARSAARAAARGVHGKRHLPGVRAIAARPRRIFVTSSLPSYVSDSHSPRLKKNSIGNLENSIAARVDAAGGGIEAEQRAAGAQRLARGFRTAGLLERCMQNELCRAVRCDGITKLITALRIPVATFRKDRDCTHREDGAADDTRRAGDWLRWNGSGARRSRVSRLVAVPRARRRRRLLAGPRRQLRGARAFTPLHSNCRLLSSLEMSCSSLEESFSSLEIDTCDRATCAESTSPRR